VENKWRRMVCGRMDTLHHHTLAAVFRLGRLGLKCDSGSFSKRLVDSPVAHCTAFCTALVRLCMYGPSSNLYVPRYLSAPIFLATSRPSLYVIICLGGNAFGSSSSFSCSSLKSHFRAHSTIFTPRQCSAISSTHFVLTFSSESALSTYSL
jgi:hypothetical protein